MTTDIRQTLEALRLPAKVRKWVTFTRQQAFAFVDRARAAFTSWGKISNKGEAAVFLVALLAHERMRA